MPHWARDLSIDNRGVRLQSFQGEVHPDHGD
jgi:hypothetical protein